MASLTKVISTFERIGASSRGKSVGTTQPDQTPTRPPPKPSKAPPEQPQALPVLGFGVCTRNRPGRRPGSTQSRCRRGGEVGGGY